MGQEPTTSKTRKRLGIIFLISVALAGWCNRRTNETSQPVQEANVTKFKDISQYPALPEDQKLKILAILKKTDALDEAYKKKANFDSFVKIAAPIENELAEFEPTLGKDDPRRTLLIKTFSRYQEAALSIKKKVNADAEIFAAYIPKRVLRDLLNNLNSSGKCNS